MIGADTLNRRFARGMLSCAGIHGYLAIVRGTGNRFTLDPCDIGASVPLRPLKARALASQLLLTIEER